MPLSRDNDEERLTRLELLLDQLRQQDDIRTEQLETQLKRLREERILLGERRGREQLGPAS